MTLPECTVHGSSCAGRKAAVARSDHAAFLRSCGEDPGEWSEPGWSPATCEAEARSVKSTYLGGMVDFDEEAHNLKRPWEKYPGFVSDLATTEVKKVWKKWAKDPRTGREGPVFSNEREKTECLRLAGYRRTDPGEVPKLKTLRERIKEDGGLAGFLRRRQ